MKALPKGERLHANIKSLNDTLPCYKVGDDVDGVGMLVTCEGKEFFLLYEYIYHDSVTIAEALTA